MSDALVRELGIPLATFLACLLSTVIPVIHAELFLIAVSALSPPAALPGLALLAALGQMLGKSAMYVGGDGIRRASARLQRATARYRRKMERWRHGDAGLVLVSSFTGLPPFALISVVAGAFEIRFRTFFLFGFAGRLGRFGIVLALPQVVKGLLA
jgi:membrane protein YqaA with SNARE-associated domain